MIERYYVIDIGPKLGNTVVKSSVKEHLRKSLKHHTITAMYMNEMKVPRREGNGKFLKLTGATGIT
jgi:excinuclease ABC subunit A